MVSSHLRIYRAPETATAADKQDENCVHVRLGDVLPLLADAVKSNRTWLRDFADDEIRVSGDLYEVLMAYKFFKPVA